MEINTMGNLLQYYIQIFKSKNLAFLSVNALSLIIIFFILDGPNDTFVYRLFYYLIGLFLGGWISYKFVIKSDDTVTNSLRKIRNGSIISLLLITSSFYFRGESKNETLVNNTSDSNEITTESSSESHTCGKCGNTFTGNGWQTVGGEQYQPTSWSGYGYCSSQCAYESQPNKWK